MRAFGLFKSLFKTSEPAQAERRATPRVDAQQDLRILVVDDSPTVAALLGKMLRQAGYQVTTAASGEAGLESVRRDPPELVFLDIVLPTMSGFAVLRALRRDPACQAIPVIMISGNLRATEEFYGQRIGADDFMKKPFGRSEVFSKIQRLVEAGRLPPRAAPVLDEVIAPAGEQDLVHDAAPLVEEDTAPMASPAPAERGADIGDDPRR